MSNSHNIFNILVPKIYKHIRLILIVKEMGVTIIMTFMSVKEMNNSIAFLKRRHKKSDIHESHLCCRKISQE